MRAWLPNDHVPSQIVRVEKIPAGPTGKIQRSRLAEILIERPPDTIPDELPDAVEALVTSAWAAQLNVGSIQSGSNFFELGGDSLSGFRVVNYLNDRFATSLTVVDIFDNPVLSDLAQRIKAVTLARIDALTEAAARAEFEMLRQRAAAHSAEE